MPRPKLKFKFTKNKRIQDGRSPVFAVNELCIYAGQFRTYISFSIGTPAFKMLEFARAARDSFRDIINNQTKEKTDV